MSWAKKLEDYPCHANGSYPGNRTDADPRVRYDEGIFMGYRYFDREKSDLRYPFGYGLSYSDFSMELVKVKQTGMTTLDAACQVTAKVTNISQRAGSELIQLYVGADAPEFERPVKELKGFARVELAPGESKEVTFELKWRDFACFHPTSHHWCLPAGKYNLFLARNAGDVAAKYDLSFKDPDAQA
jgi:beta-glucosidase